MNRNIAAKSFARQYSVLVNSGSGLIQVPGVRPGAGSRQIVCFYYVGRPLRPPRRGSAAGGVVLPQRNLRNVDPRIPAGPPPWGGRRGCVAVPSDSDIGSHFIVLFGEAMQHLPGPELCWTLLPAVFQDVFDFALVAPLPGGSGGGSGLSFSLGDRRLWADSGPDPG
jgi:hypothetical protein